MKSILNPYVGLRPFESKESHLFFGRREQSADLLDKLERTRFLAVVGSSGCGKSSLIRAGLIPLVQAGFLVDDRDTWLTGVMKPGDRPLYHLARAICSVLDNEPDSEEIERFHDIISIEGAQAIVDRLSPVLSQTRACLLLLVDQFEEIFRFAQNSDPDEAAFFVTILLDLASQTHEPVYSVLTMRSDFIGDCDQFQGLPEAMNHSQYLVPRMTREQQREAIIGPAAIAGSDMPHDLVQRVLNDMSNDPDQLPVMQHALMRTWDAWCDDNSEEDEDTQAIDVPTIAHYESIGTLSKALSMHANSIYENLVHKDLAMRVFKALTDQGTDGRGIRRATQMADIYAITGVINDDTPEITGIPLKNNPYHLSDVNQIIDTFRQPGCSFLMPSIYVPLHSEVVIDISHESLMRVWDRMEQWVSDENQSVRDYRRLSETALRYQKGSANYLRDPELQLYQKWYETQQPNGAWARQYHSLQEEERKTFEKSIDFLNESIVNQTKEIEAKERADNERLELEKKALLAEQKNRYQKRILVAVIIGFFIAMGISGFAVYQYLVADTARKYAVEQREIAIYNARIARQEKENAIAALEKYEEERLKVAKKTQEIDKLQNTLNPLGERQGRLYLLDMPEQTRVNIKGISQTYASGMKLDAGTYDIQLSHKNYYPMTISVDIREGKENQIRTKLKPLPSEIKISGTPDDALVIVNNETKGQGAMTLSHLVPGIYRIRIEKELFESFITDLTLGPNDSKNILYDLAGLVKLTILPRPSDARVRIMNIRPIYEDGIILTPGRYEVEVSHPGYYTFKKWLTLSQGERQIAVLLDKKPEKQITNEWGMTFVYISPGAFIMGSADHANEIQHKVIFTKGFYIQTTEVTQGHWIDIMGDNPSHFVNCGKNCPVEKVSWGEVQAFIKRLSAQDRRQYQLPTEAQWEYAARAGTHTAFANGNIQASGCRMDANLDQMGWYCGNSSDRTHPVAQKQPNDWGIYDMHGNVWEWCMDWYDQYPSTPVNDPVNTEQTKARVVRGGSWTSDVQSCRSAGRFKSGPANRIGDLGFRLVIPWSGGNQMIQVAPKQKK